MAERPRFLADAMLSRLARWLRVLDCDTRCHPDWSDPALVELADAEGRWLLTRDRALVAELKPNKALLLGSDRPLTQLQTVVEATDLTPPAALFRRCLVCNTPLRPATSAESRTLAPATARAFDDHQYCDGCQRLYWPGSHTRRMATTLAEALPSWRLPLTAPTRETSS